MRGQPECLASVKKNLEPYVVKMKHFRTVQEGEDVNKRLVVLNSRVVSQLEDFKPKDWSTFHHFGVKEEDFHFREFRWGHRIRMNTEEKAKVVAAALGRELIQFLAPG